MKKEEKMLSASQARTVASVLIDRLGAVTPAAAMLRAQEAGERGALLAMLDWRRIAEQSLRQLESQKRWTS